MASIPENVATPPPARLTSLDAFRGAVMLLMASGGLGLAEVARRNPDSALLRFLGEQTDHAAWRGCTVWDLIQPAFMFMVGVALPWSIANRRARGATFPSMLGHALLRAVLLVLLGVFLASAWSKQTDWNFVNVLAQIGLGYPFLFLVAFTSVRTQWIVAGVILVATWLAFVLYQPATGSGPPAELGPWTKGANFAAAVDVHLLNAFPRTAAFTHNSGGYQTLNFIPSLATMIFGLLAGNLLRGTHCLRRKVGSLVVAGIGLIVLGTALDVLGLCPIVKRIWTPSFALYSTGWVAITLAAFVAVIDWRGWKRWTFPLLVAGLNPIALYFMWQLMSSSIRGSIKTHFGQRVFEIFGTGFTPLAERLAVVIVLWLILWWMYRRRIFLKI